jgi:hypothetical protein
VPNRYAAALRPDSASTYCGPRSLNCSYASVSSRGVNLSRALGVTTTLVVTARSPSLPRTPTHDAHNLPNFVEAALGTRVKKTASVRSWGQREAHPIFFFDLGHGGNPIARSLASLSTSKVWISSQRVQRQ